MDELPPRVEALARVALAYVVALFAGAVVLLALGPAHPVRTAFLADLVATGVVFAFSYRHDNSSFYDPYWSVIPPFLVAWWAFTADGGWLRQAVVLGLVTWWGARLTWNWMRGWTGLDHEDWRYVDLRRFEPYWVVSLLGLHLFPTIQVFLGLLGAYMACAGGRGLGLFDLLGVAVLAGGIRLETVADRELRAFRLAGHAEDKLLDTGAWAWSRHPNYLGEILVWWGLWLLGLGGAGLAAAWTVVGPLAITLMFVFVSVPMIERRMLARRPGYADVQRRIPMLLPRLV